MFRMNGMLRMQGCTGAACVSFARHLEYGTSKKPRFDCEAKAT